MSTSESGRAGEGVDDSAAGGTPTFDLPARVSRRGSCRAKRRRSFLWHPLDHHQVGARLSAPSSA